MGAYVVQRLLHFIPVILLTSLVIFVGIRLAPGDPAQFLAGPDPSAETLAAIRERLGLDRNIVIQFLLWLRGLLTADLGQSMVNGLPVGDLVLQRLGATLELAVAGLALSVGIGGALGIAAGLRPRSLTDKAVSAFSAIGLSMPLFWTGLLLVLVLGVKLEWFPVAGRVPFGDGILPALGSLALPALTVAIGNAPIVARFLRQSIVEARRADHVRAAYAKGLPGRVVVRDYVVRNSLIPMVTVAGIILGNLIGGAALVEIVFAWPGIGQLLVTALGNRDYSVVQGAMLVAVGGFLVANLLVDISYGLLDPRIRRSHGG
jgi:ABC-type dipeptide/oligopeptide/nickel transport system permease component